MSEIHEQNKERLASRLLHTGKANNNPLIPLIPPKYRSVVIFKTALCNNCKQMIVAKDIIICRSLDELINRAETEHENLVKSGQLLCLKAQLFITHENALILSELLTSGEIG